MNFYNKFEAFVECKFLGTYLIGFRGESIFSGKVLALKFDYNNA